MKPLYVKKNGVVYKISGAGMPSTYPAANVEYDNTITSELQATDVQGAIDELSTKQGGVQSDWNENDSTKLDYIKNKPQNLVQDASYVHTDNNYDATAKGKVDALGTASTKDVGVANGVAELDSAGKVPSSQLPSFVDDVIEVADYDHLPITGESGKIYVTLDTNKTYRWTGSGYTEISESLALGETSSTAYRGDKGKTAYDHATETKLSTVTTSGLYKVAATAQGHIASLTAVEKSDITALGIPGQDTIIKNTAYGTCDTAGDVKDKVATLVNATNWVLEIGTIIGIRFTYTNTYTPSSGNVVTLNVNNTGAKNIRYSDGIWSSADDSKCPTAFGEANQIIYYLYDGTYWVWVSHSKDNDTLYNFVGREFRSCDWNDAGLETGFGGDANLMVVNGVYYYSSNGPSTSIGASANDGSVFVHTCDDGYVVQIAQNYETGNLFVRAMNDSTWGDWKKIALDTDVKAIEDKIDESTTSISGNPISITGLKSDQLAINPVITYNPIQDLHGQDKPYPAGGGKNILPTTVDNIKSWNTAGTWSGNAYVYNGVTYTILTDDANNVIGIKVNGTASLNSGLKLSDTMNNYLTDGVLYILNGCPANGSTTTYYFCIGINFDASRNAVETGSGVSLNYSESTHGAKSAYIGLMANTSVSNITFYPMIVLATVTDRTFAPYENICPISGYDKVEVLSCGKNLFNGFTPQTGYSFTITQSGDSYTISGGGGIFISQKVYANKTYILTANITSGSFTNIRIYNDFSATELVGYIAIGTAFTPSKDGYIRFWKDSTAITIDNIQLEMSGSSTTYVPYHKTTDISESLGQTVYGGSLDVRTGKFTVTHGRVDLGDLKWQSRHTAYANVFSTASITDYKFASDVDGVCSGYNYDGVAGGVASFGTKENATICFYYSPTGTDRVLYIKDSRYSTDANAFTTAVTGINFVYELATPFTIQLTPHEISLLKDYAYVSTNGTLTTLDYHNGEMASLGDVVQLSETVENLQTKLNYHDYTVKGNGTTTWGDLLESLRPTYESLSENEKTFSKLIFRSETISYNECLSYCGAYWYSRMGLTNSGNIQIDHASLVRNGIYYYQKNGDVFTDKTSETTSHSLSLRVFVEVGNDS